MSRRYFIADTHFGHTNVIKYESRPFQTAAEMDKVLIQNWNSVVKKTEKVYMLGDFAFSNKERIKEIILKLNGYKILVLGNHDRCYSNSWWIKQSGFNEVSPYPIILDGFWVLSHEPMYTNGTSPFAHIYGHVHGNPMYNDYSAQTICVSVERPHMNYTPIEFEAVKKLMGITQRLEEISK